MLVNLHEAGRVLQNRFALIYKSTKWNKASCFDTIDLDQLAFVHFFFVLRCRLIWRVQCLL